MKKIRAFLFVLFLMLAVSVVSASALQTSFRATLTGGQEVPAVHMAGSGSFKADFSSDMVMSYRLRYDHIERATAAHIHCAPAGVNGPVGVTLHRVGKDGVNGSVSAPDAGNACGWQTMADVQMAMASGNAYVNVHSTTVPSGQIRGQIR